MSRLYSIALPVADNAGKSTAAALAEFERIALDVVGGCTVRPDGRGAWKDPGTGVVYNDTMRPYEVACGPGAFAKLCREARRLFPDQLAFFTAELGRVRILDAAELVALAS